MFAPSEVRRSAAAGPAGRAPKRLTAMAASGILSSEEAENEAPLVHAQKVSALETDAACTGDAGRSSALLNPGADGMPTAMDETCGTAAVGEPVTVKAGSAKRPADSHVASLTDSANVDMAVALISSTQQGDTQAEDEPATIKAGNAKRPKTHGGAAKRGGKGLLRGNVHRRALCCYRCHDAAAAAAIDLLFLLLPLLPLLAILLMQHSVSWLLLLLLPLMLLTPPPTLLLLPRLPPRPSPLEALHGHAAQMQARRAPSGERRSMTRRVTANQVGLATRLRARPQAARPARSRQRRLVLCRWVSSVPSAKVPLTLPRPWLREPLLLPTRPCPSHLMPQRPPPSQPLPPKGPPHMRLRRQKAPAWRRQAPWETTRRLHL